MITIASQRKLIAQYIDELIDNNNSITIVMALGECMQELEFELQEVPEIKDWRAENPTKTFEDYYNALGAKG